MRPTHEAKDVVATPDNGMRETLFGPEISQSWLR